MNQASVGDIQLATRKYHFNMRSIAKSLHIPSTEQLARSFCCKSQSFSLPDLPYDYGELEPVLPARIMELHHSKVRIHFVYAA